MKDLNCERVGQSSQQSRAVSRLPGLPNWACKSLCTLAFTSLRTHGVCHIQHTRHGSSWPLLRGSSLSPDDDPHPLTCRFPSQTTPLSVSNLSILLVLIALSFISPFIFRRNIVDKDGHPIPPGPLFRYAFLRRYPERALRAWSRTYGPIFSVWMGNQLFVVISDARVAKDLLVSNSAIFSSRRLYFMKNQTILHARAITATPYNDTW